MFISTHNVIIDFLVIAAISVALRFFIGQLFNGASVNSHLGYLNCLKILSRFAVGKLFRCFLLW